MKPDVHHAGRSFRWYKAVRSLVRDLSLNGYP